jgi:ATP-dependent Clp protease ATP-binding subunit ClpB
LTIHTAPAAEESVMSEIRSSFKPELLNRLDDIILFQLLSARDLTSIVHIQLRDLTKRLAEKEMTLELTAAATDLILNASYVRASVLALLDATWRNT